MNEPKIVLIGLGPHAKRIYLKCFEVNNIKPSLIIDLKDKEQDIQNCLKEHNIECDCYFLDTKSRNSTELEEQDYLVISSKLKELEITHAVISTEPKAHYMFIKMLLALNIHILVDKPLTAPINVSTDVNQAKKIVKDYTEILKLYKDVNKKKKTILQIQCQRRWHKGYKFIHNLASNIVKKYRIPITAIQISHGDGMWNMPDEFLSRENHPYKYGYGKMFHSGYHFLDLACWFESINHCLESKRANSYQVYAVPVRPDDFMTIINKEDYHNLLKTDKFDYVFDNINEYKFNEFGEIDLYSLIQCKHNDKVITTITLNLMQNTFSRRAWDTLPVDTYKGNGRVRHEYMNIEIGPLMNIQVHSYQSKEIKDKIDGAIGVGEVENFDIYVFRNTELIGGEPFEKYTLNDIYDHKIDMQGYNEEAREVCFRNFIDCSFTDELIGEHDLSIHLLEKIYESVCSKNSNSNPEIKFES